MIKYMLPDSSPEELHIYIQETDLEADGEFVFDTANDAKNEALVRINRALSELERTKEVINNYKGLIND